MQALRRPADMQLFRKCDDVAKKTKLDVVLSD
jgi:hypothetical protein